MATATESQVQTRHKSQLRILDLLDAYRDAIESLPLDADVGWHGNSSALYIDEPVFREMFRGQSATLDKLNGVLSREVDGIRYASLLEKPHSRATTEVTL